MDELLYKVFHVLGLLLVFAALGGATIATRLGKGDAPEARRLVGISHGVGLVLMLISGFGMLARLQLGFPPWIWVKVGIWMLLGASGFLIRSQPGWASALWFALPLVGTFAAYLAIYKPF